jgi:hypothetical protein
MAATGQLDGRVENMRCGVKGCNRKIITKATLGKLRQGTTTLRCSAGHETIVDGRHLDKDLREFERTTRIFK